MKPTHKDHARALARANDLYDAYWHAQGAKDRAEIKNALEALFRGEHPDFLGVKISHAAFDLKSIPTWDTAYTLVLNCVPTRDVGIFFRRPTRDEKPEELFDDDGTAVEMIMSALKDLAARCDALDKLPMFRAPTQDPPLTPRVLNPQQAYAAAMTAYQMNQAKFNQRRAHEAGFAPRHPDDVKEDALEAQQAQDGGHFGTRLSGRPAHRPLRQRNEADLQPVACLTEPDEQ